MSGGVKMHFKSVSVYVNLSKNSLSPDYGMYKTLVALSSTVFYLHSSKHVKGVCMWLKGSLSSLQLYFIE